MNSGCQLEEVAWADERAYPTPPAHTAPKPKFDCPAGSMRQPAHECRVHEPASSEASTIPY